MLCPFLAVSDLSLQPSDKIVIKRVGEDNSWFVSCGGSSSESLIWQHKSSNDKLKEISAAPHEKVHSEPAVSGKGLDLVFRSVEQGYEGQYICSHKQNVSNKVAFDLVVVQPIDFDDTPTTQMVKVECLITKSCLLIHNFSSMKQYTV